MAAIAETTEKKHKTGRFFWGARSLETLAATVWKNGIALDVDKSTRVLLVCYESVANRLYSEGSDAFALWSELSLLLHGVPSCGIMSVVKATNHHVAWTIHDALRLLPRIRVVIYVGRNGFRWQQHTAQLAPLSKITSMTLGDLDRVIVRRMDGTVAPPLSQEAHDAFVKEYRARRLEDSREWPLPLVSGVFERLLKVLAVLSKEEHTDSSITLLLGALDASLAPIAAAVATALPEVAAEVATPPLPQTRPKSSGLPMWNF
jgi:hypothetical protein